jgi:hypothetical protein
MVAAALPIALEDLDDARLVTRALSRLPQSNRADVVRIALSWCGITRSR